MEAIYTYIIKIVIQIKNAVPVDDKPNHPAAPSPPKYCTRSICKNSTRLETIATIYITAKAIREGTSIFPLRLYTAYPIQIAKGIWINTGNTLAGKVINKLEMTQAKTALTIKTKIRIINKNKILARCPTNLLANVPIEFPLCRTDNTNVPKSWTPAAKTVPKSTHKPAGSHPQ